MLSVMCMGDAAQALVQYLIMNTAGVYGYSLTTFRMRIHSKNESRNVAQDDPTKGVGQRHVDAVDCEFKLTIFVGFRNYSRDIFADSRLGMKWGG